MHRVSRSDLTVTREEFPRVVITFEKIDDHYDSSDVEWIDKPPMDVALLSRVMREAGDALLAKLKEQSN